MKTLAKSTGAIAFILIYCFCQSLSAQTISTFPHVEDFESFSTCGTSCGNACSLTNGWVNFLNDDADWTVDEDGTVSGSTGPTIDHNPGTTTGNYLYTETSGTSCQNATIALITPPLDLSSLSNFSTDFWYHMYGADTGSIHVDVSNTNGFLWDDDVIPAISDNRDLWQKQTVNLDAYVGDTIILRIRAVTGDGFESDMALDDFTFYFFSPEDAGVASIDAPTTPLSAGNNDIIVTLTNYGTDTLKKADVQWSVNNLLQTTYNWSGSLAQNESASVTIGTYNFPNGSFDIKAWTQNPNDSTDQNHLNDTSETSVCTALSGTFTIGGSTPDFTSFTDAVNSLAACGVSGPVTLNVAPGSGPYNEQVSIPAITGASAVNTITFNGNGDTLAFSPNSSDRHILKLDGAKHIVLNNLVIKGTDGTYGWGIMLTNSADSNIINNCIIDVSAVTSTTSTNSVGITATGSTSSTTSGGINASYCTFTNNTIIGGYYCVTLNGSIGVKATNNIFMDNSIQDFYSYGIYLNDNNGTQVIGNDISRPDRTNVSTFYGVYLTSGNLNVMVAKNRIHNTHDNASSVTGTVYGIYFSSSDAFIGSENKAVNNIIYNINTDGAIYGIYNSSSNGAHYYHNTISLDYPAPATGGTTRGFYQTSVADNIEFKNNIITITRGGTGTMNCIYLGSTGSNVVSDNNVFFIDTSTNDVGYYSGAFNSLADWQTANGGAYDQNSVFTNPMFVDETTGDLLPTNGEADGIGDTLGVTEDIRGTSRSLTDPDPGAFEFDPPTLDADITWIAPSVPTVAGLATVIVSITNNASSLSAITSLNLTYTDNVSPVTEQFNALNIAPGATQNISFTTQYNLTSMVNIRAYINAVNGSSDGIQLNDTTDVQSLCPSLSGQYIIDKAFPTGGNNFNSFSDAINALSTCGIQGPVVISVASGSGPYNEQITIGPVNGASTTNTVTFKGNNDTLTFAPVPNDRHILKLDGAKHIIIDSLVIIGTDNTYGWGIHLLNNADSNTIANSTIDVSAVQSTSSSNSVAIVGSNSTTSVTTSGQSTSYLTLLNNILVGGYYGIRINGSSSDKVLKNNIRNNTIRDFETYAMYLDDNEGNIIADNDISRANRLTSSTFYGIYLTATVNTDVERNRIHNTHDNAISLTGACYGIYISSSDAAIGEENRVVNNVLYNLNNNGTLYAIYNSTSDGAHYYHNTIAINDTTATTTSSTRGFYQTSVADNIEFKNNIVSITRGGTGAKHAIYLGTSSSTIDSDHNAFYINAGGTNNHIGYYDGTSYTSLTNWQAANPINPYDLNSYVANPMFTNAATGNLLPVNSVINSIGTGVGVMEDITMMPRNLDFPDPGAYEFRPSGLDAGISWIAPQPPLVPGNYTITVNINNARTDTITSVALTYTDGNTPVSEIFTGLTLAADENQDLSFSTQYNLSGFADFVAFIDSVNGTVDENQSNDTVTKSVCTALSGSYTIDATAPSSATNFQSFTDAISVMISCGVGGPVVFDVVSGSGPYTEQLTLSNIDGVSAINTVTFNGNGENLMFQPSSGSRAIITLDGVAHIIINDLEITGTDGTYGWGFHLINQADSNVINNCTIDISAVTSTITSNSVGIVLSNSSTSVTTNGNNGNYNLFTNNTIIGGYSSIYINGENGAGSMSNTIAGNTIEDFYSYGIYLNETDGTQIMDNDINRATRTTVSTFYGIYLTGGNQNVNIKRNRIHNTHDNASSTTSSVYGIYLSATDAPTGMENRIINNAIYNINSDGITYALYNSGSDGAFYYHNTVSLDNTSATGSSSVRGFYQITTADNIEFKNNIISITRTGSGDKHCVYLSTTTSTIDMDYNLYYVDITQANQFVGRYGTTNFAGLNNWQTANGGAYDQNSIFLNPIFSDPDNGILVPLDTTANDRGTALNIPLDIDLNTRDIITPDIGAFEFTPNEFDVAITGMIQPVSNSCGADSIPVIIVLKNFGYANVSNVPVTAMVSGAVSAMLTATSSANLGNTAIDTIFVGNFSLQNGGNITIKAFSSLAGDGITSNDTLMRSLILETTPDAPIPGAYDDTICKTISATLNVVEDTALTYRWYDVPFGGTFIHEGPTYITPNLDSSTTYYVEALATTKRSVGPAAPVSTTDFFTDGWGIVFDAINTVTIDTVFIYPASNGILQVYIADANGVPVSDSTFIIIGISQINQRVPLPLGFTVPAGTDYRLVTSDLSTVTGLRRELSGAMFPYSIPGAISLTSSYNGGTTTGPYYWFYDWQVTILGCESVRSDLPVFVNTAQTPVMPQFTYNVGSNGLNISFLPIDNRIDNNFQWEFGDNSTSNIGSISHTYQNDGSYTACLTVTNQCNQDSSCQTFTICRNLMSSFNYTQDPNNLTVDFAYNGIGTPTGFIWDFGDLFGSTNATPSHGYQSAGAYNVKLIAENDCGDVDSVNMTINVCTPIEANFGYQQAGTTIQFTDSSSGNNLTYAWDFGDGTTDSTANPVHNYSTGGVYTVILTVSDTCGRTITSTQQIDLNVGIKEHGKIGLMFVYPNPNEGEFLLQYTLARQGKVYLKIINILGEVIYQNDGIRKAGEHLEEMDLKSFGKGIYLLELKDEENTRTKRIIIN